MAEVEASGEPYKGLGKFGTQLNMNTDTIGEVRIPLPPMTEQGAIVLRLDEEIVALRDLVETIQLGINVLQEYRAALITAAVTGKIDVREEVA